MLETNNLYYASFLFAEGFTLVNIERRRDEKFGETVVFTFGSFDPESERRAEVAYNEGRAMVNVRRYLTSLEKVRDILHGLRPQEQETQKNQGTGYDERRRTERIAAKH